MPGRKLSDMRIVQDPRPEEEINSDELTSVGYSEVPETIEIVTIECNFEHFFKMTRWHTSLKELYQLPLGESMLKFQEMMSANILEAEACV
ncbi:hypothetical protein GQ457_13G017690 [Hibiscus cannabinus]